MGMSFAHGEFLVDQGHPDQEYPVLVEELAIQGLIDAPAFSQYLNDVRSEGEILLGGVDNAKHIDEIKEFDLIPNSDGNYTVSSTELECSIQSRHHLIERM